MDKVGKPAKGPHAGMGEGSRLLSKKDLCIIMGLHNAGNATYLYATLRQKVFTDDILSQLGMTPEEYRRTRIFDRATTLRIIELLKITPDEISDLTH